MEYHNSSKGKGLISSKHMFVLASFAVGCLCVCMINLKKYNLSQVTSLKEAVSSAHQLNTDVLLLRKNEKNFLTRLNWAEIKKFESNTYVLEEHIAQLSRKLVDKPELAQNLDAIIVSLEKYKRSFKAACEFNVKIGFDYDHGLRGRLKDTYYQTEAYIKSLEDIKEFEALEYLNRLLALSVHEKNFLLKVSNKYFNRFSIGVTRILEDIGAEAALSPVLKNKLIEAIEDYHNTFEELAEMIVYQQRDIQSPLEELSKSAHEIEYTIYYVSHKIIDDFLSDETEQRSYSSLALFAFSLGLFILAIAPFLSLLLGKARQRGALSSNSSALEFFAKKL